MKRRSPIVYLLATLLILEGLSGLPAGVGLVMAPDGSNIGLPPEMLDGTPFNDFLIPGLILTILVGLVPLFAGITLLFRPAWRFPDRLNPYPDRHWSWALALYSGFIVTIWIFVQIMLIGAGSILQAIYGAWGILLLVLALLPPVMKDSGTARVI